MNQLNRSIFENNWTSQSLVIATSIFENDFIAL